MGRSIIAGLTDYSAQTIGEMSDDLQEWNSYLSEVCSRLNKIINELKESGYWEKAYYNFCEFVLHCIDFYERSNEEIKEIRSEIQNEIQMHHVSRLRTIGMKADELNREIGKLWHREYPNNMKDYTNPDFLKVETLYGKSRDAVANLLDLINLASRLQDFVGKKRGGDSKSVDLNEIVELKPNFMGLGININALIKKLFKRR
ncbi:MAG: hypothetical protein IIC75_04400 [Bacteroidetes bacterium]|nr:hypothetical protein [Bacteroidota bacterium]